MKIKKSSIPKILAAMIIVVICGITIFKISVPMSVPTVAEFPNDTTSLQKLRPSDKLITLLLEADRFVYAYEKEELHNTTKLHLSEVQSYLQKSANGKPLFVVVKHSPAVPYHAIVAVLNHLTIREVREYSLVSAAPEEISFIENNK